jgi:hypothetical protein
MSPVLFMMLDLYMTELLMMLRIGKESRCDFSVCIFWVVRHTACIDILLTLLFLHALHRLRNWSSLCRLHHRNLRCPELIWCIHHLVILRRR